MGASAGAEPTARASQTRTRPLVDFLVVGAQRSATTHLNTRLGDHPEIFMCPDEVPYFEHPFFARSKPSELRAAVAAATPHQRRGIQRPDYLARPECAPNIKSVVPDARILAVLRDPVARAISAYHWYVQFGLLPLLPLDVGIARLLDGWTDPSHPRASEILDLGFYGRHLARYVDAFGADRILVVLNEDLDNPTTFQTIYRFLGVAEDHEPRTTTRRTNAGTYDLRRLRVLRARRRFAWSWDHVDTYEYRPRRLRRPAASLVSAAVVALDQVVLARVFPNGSPVLRPDLEARLREVYADDVVRLESLLGRGLATWRTPG
ncbi:MAG: sulfotransferase domain-containing protein [Deltaproteobacteria bacterium]|nr:sulfotransferase domain-containing protein [Deltaproteobacteria bacterium]